MPTTNKRRIHVLSAAPMVFSPGGRGESPGEDLKTTGTQVPSPESLT